jgi:hypothetical protein
VIHRPGMKGLVSPQCPAPPHRRKGIRVMSPRDDIDWPCLASPSYSPSLEFSFSLLDSALSIVSSWESQSSR